MASSFLYYQNGSVSANGNFDDSTSMTGSIGTITGSRVGSSLFRSNTPTINMNGSLLNKSSKLVLKQIGDSIEDDVHVCVSCLRALMNNKFGLNMVLNNQKAIYCILLSIRHHSLRYFLKFLNAKLNKIILEQKRWLLIYYLLFVC